MKVKKNSKTRPNRSILKFNNKTSSVTYKPLAPPYGLVFKKRLVFSGKVLFLTGWAHGTHSVLFRVFYPEKNKGQPLCELISFSETAGLQLKDKVLKIEVTQEDSGASEPKWALCYDFS